MTTSRVTSCKVCGTTLSNGQDMCLYCAATADADLHRFADATTLDSDPNGIDQHAPGSKLDAGKPRVGLMMDGFSLALMEVAKVTTYGAEKYTPSGWETVQDGEQRYKDAMLRHLLLGSGATQEEFDQESGLRHLACMCWNSLAILELHMRSSHVSSHLPPGSEG